MQAAIKIICDADFTPDFLRQLANEIEAREEQDDFDFEIAEGCAEVVYDEE
jgi:hypothetical protein